MSANLTNVLAEQAAARPEQVALVHGFGEKERSITFRELARQVDQAAAGWQSAGLRPGDAVLIFHPMSIDLYVALLGLLRAGLVAVFVDPRAGLGQLTYAREKLPPKAILASAATRLLCWILPQLRGAGPVLTPAKLTAGSSAPLPETTAESPALVTWTSGSTGRPKGIVRTHGFLLLQHRLLEKHLHLRPGEVDLTSLPIFVLANLASGVTSVLMPGKIGQPAKADPRQLEHQVLRWKITRSAGSPALYQRLAESPRALEAMRAIYTGGAPVFPSLLERLRLLSPECRLISVYGSTEAEPIADAPYDPTPRQGYGLYQGHPVPEVELAIIRDETGHPLGELGAADFADLRLPAGQCGEIVVTGEHVIQGYLGGIGDSETKFRVDGRAWHRTGDAGYLDADGALWLLGRCSALAPSHNPRQPADYPFVVEVAAMALPGIDRAALLEYDHARILFYEGVSQEIALPWARLDHVRRIKRIPLDRRHQAKVDYAALRREAARLKLVRP
jgi:acyl-CoA synthetase (AMP-forming)/AMP-acid ligase II